MNANQLIVGKNATRRTSNMLARKYLNYEDPLPVVGDKLVCLRNNRKEGLMNGTIWFVTATNTEFSGDPDSFFPPAFRCNIKSEDTDLELTGVQMHKGIFLGEEIPWHDMRLANEFDFGYALTCHKAQGSQWSHVVVYDESRVFRNDKWKWLYTAATRAAEKLNICLL
jgi:exodeoxyribonuclease-5